MSEEFPFVYASVKWEQTIRSYTTKDGLWMGAMPGIILGIMVVIVAAITKDTVRLPILMINVVAPAVGIGMGVACLLMFVYSLVTNVPDIGYVTEKCEFRVVCNQFGELQLHLKCGRTPFRRRVSETYGFATLTGFSIGSEREWFHNPADRLMYADSTIILANYSDRAPVPVAQFGFTSRMEVTHVFYDLQNQILNRRADIMKLHVEMWEGWECLQKLKKERQAAEERAEKERRMAEAIKDGYFDIFKGYRRPVPPSETSQ